MCGIVGYIGYRNAYDVILRGLKRLEYRGYDSAGIAVYEDTFNIYKCKGKVSDLENLLKDKTFNTPIGIGHTRWATHGEPNDVNAHPHTSMNKKFVIIHNGIIENYAQLKTLLLKHNYNFKSETDTEVLANLFEFIYQKDKSDKSIEKLESSIKTTLQMVEGTYGLVILCNDFQNQMIIARRGSPIVIGIGKDEYFVASDATPIVEYTNSVIYLNDNDIAIITTKDLNLTNLKNIPQKPNIQTLDLKIDEIEKGGFEHYMLKEIYEQPRSVKDTYRGRLNVKNHSIKLGGLFNINEELLNTKRIIIVACGTSWHAGLIGEYLLEEIARVPTEVEYASEFRYRNPIINKGDVVIAISQSGETADTLAAIQLAKAAGAIVIGICNVVGSSIARETDAGVYTHAGPEIGVASTKAFTSQVTVLTMMAITIGHHNKTISIEKYSELIKELSQVPDKIQKIIEKNDLIKNIAEKIKDSSNCLYLGRGNLYPVAMEGALKLKEISYIHAEGYPAAEMKHGPIALIDDKMPVIVIATKDSSYDKIVSNIQEVKARKGIIIAIVSEGDTIIKALADYVIEIPECNYILAPLLTVIPLQLLSYYIAVLRGCNVDQPRNLAKSVTVE